MSARCSFSFCRHSETMHILREIDGKEVTRCISCNVRNGEDVGQYHEFKKQKEKAINDLDSLIAINHEIVDLPTDEESAKHMHDKNSCPLCNQSKIKRHYLLAFFTGKYVLSCKNCGLKKEYKR